MASRAAHAAVGAVSLASPPNGGYVNATPTLKWNAATGATAYTLTVTPLSGTPLVKAGLTATSYTIAAAEILSDAGNPYTWRVVATDGTTTQSSPTSSFFVDTTPPSAFGLTTPAAGAFVRGSNSGFTWTAATDSPGSGISKYHFYVDGALCGDVTGAFFSFLPSTCNPTDGPHTWAVSAEDVAGNIRWCNEAPGGAGGRAFVTDNTGPSAGSGGVFQLSSNNQPDAFNAPSDRMVNTGINVTPGDQISVTSTGTWCFLGCTSACFDTNGYVNQVNLPTQNCNAGTLLARVGGGSQFKCVGKSGMFTAGINDSGILELGSNSEQAGCNDKTVTATVTGGRVFALISPDDGAVTNQQFPTFAWQAAADPGSGGVTYLLNLDGVSVGESNTNPVGTVFTNTTYTSTDRLGDGAHSWNVRARDAVGNITDSTTRTFTVDTTKPEQFRLRTPAMNACSIAPTPSLCWNNATDAGGIATYQLWIDGALAFTTTDNFTTCGTPSVALAPGMHTWYAVAIDRAGNARQSIETFNLLVDYTAPAAPALVAPANNSSSADQPLFTWMAAADAGGIASYQIYVDGNLAQTVDGKTLSWLVPSDLADGMHTWYVRAVDNCGQAAASAMSTFTITACAPDGNTPHRCSGYNLGPCTPGARTCLSAGMWSACAGAVGPAIEVCNNIDDNCNGLVDEGTLGQGFVNTCGGVCQLPFYVYTPCDGPDADLCQEGVYMCDGLNGETCVETTPVELEVCNGRDDDCDGVIDNDCAGGSGPDGGATPDAGQTMDGSAGGMGGTSGAGGNGGAGAGGHDGGSASDGSMPPRPDGSGASSDGASSDASDGSLGGHPPGLDSGAGGGGAMQKPSSGCGCTTAPTTGQPLASAVLLCGLAVWIRRRRRR